MNLRKSFINLPVFFVFSIILIFAGFSGIIGFGCFYTPELHIAISILFLLILFIFIFAGFWGLSCLCIIRFNESTIEYRRLLSTKTKKYSYERIIYVYEHILGKNKSQDPILVIVFDELKKPTKRKQKRPHKELILADNEKNRQRIASFIKMDILESSPFSDNDKYRLM